MDWRELFKAILNGFKRIGKFILFMAWIASLIWGILSIVPIALGKLPFDWWDIPCWIILLFTIAGAIGAQ